MAAVWDVGMVAVSDVHVRYVDVVPVWDVHVRYVDVVAVWDVGMVAVWQVYMRHVRIPSASAATPSQCAVGLSKCCAVTDVDRFVLQQLPRAGLPQLELLLDANPASEDLNEPLRCLGHQQAQSLEHLQRVGEFGSEEGLEARILEPEGKSDRCVQRNARSTQRRLQGTLHLHRPLCVRSDLHAHSPFHLVATDERRLQFCLEANPSFETHVHSSLGCSTGLVENGFAIALEHAILEGRDDVGKAKFAPSRDVDSIRVPRVVCLHVEAHRHGSLTDGELELEVRCELGNEAL
jgi:hypothetical protein